MAKKVIIIGASAGIGRALALAMSKAGYEVGITARRKELLKMTFLSKMNRYVKWIAHS